MPRRGREPNKVFQDVFKHSEKSNIMNITTKVKHKNMYHYMCVCAKIQYIYMHLAIGM